MGDNLTPTQRKQARLQTKQVASSLSSANDLISALTEDEIAEDDLWKKWEAEARQMTQTQEGWQSYMDQKALEVMQQIEPGTAHAKYGGKPWPMTPEMRKRLFEAVTNDQRPRKKGK